MDGQVFYVYFLVNQSGVIEYIGETTRPKTRMYDHTRRPYKKYAGFGRFYGRTDLTMQIVAEHDSREKSYKHQCELQTLHGFPTDAQNRGQHSLENTRSLRKFSDEEVAAIRELHARGGITYKSIADSYGVTSGCISKICRYQVYKKLSL